MPSAIRGVLQLDFDGTLAHEDVSTGLLAHFAAPKWVDRVNAASRELLTDLGSTALVDTMIAGFAALTGSAEEQMRYAREHHPPRPGLPGLIDVAGRLGLECHVVSNGFEFYIRDYLREAGVEGRVQVHTGSSGADGALRYLAPDGTATRSRFKLGWSEHFVALGGLLVYVGDGTSDVAPAQLASIVFARDGLLAGMPANYSGIVRPFDTLHDVAKGLEEFVRQRG